MSSNMLIQKTCQFCGREFTAKTTVTKYCSQKCGNDGYRRTKRAESKKSKKLSANSTDIDEIRLRKIKNKPMLTISDAALLFGVTRPTIYSYINNKQLKVIKMGCKTFLRQDEIISQFYANNPPETKLIPNLPTTPKVYAISEIKNKYNVKETWIYKMIKQHKIPKQIDKGKSFYSKSLIDKIFATKAPNPNIAEWYSVEQIKDKYGMTTVAIYSFVSDHNIPRKRDGRKTYYSKDHFDKAKGADIKIDDINYYTIDEAKAKYNLSRDSFYAIIKRHNIPKVKDGRRVLISRLALDEHLK